MEYKITNVYVNDNAKKREEAIVKCLTNAAIAIKHLPK